MHTNNLEDKSVKSFIVFAFVVELFILDNFTGLRDGFQILGFDFLEQRMYFVVQYDFLHLDLQFLVLDVLHVIILAIFRVAQLNIDIV